MSFFPGQDPEPGNTFQCDAIERVIVPRTTDLGSFQVRRALPSAMFNTTLYEARRNWSARRCCS